MPSVKYCSLLTMVVKNLLMVKLLMLISFVCFSQASVMTEIKDKKFKKIYVEEDSWVSNEISALDSQGRLNG